MPPKMAAISPIRTPEPEPRKGGISLLGVLKVAIVLALVGGSAWMLFTHAEWFENPRQVKVEVLHWGLWGPLVFIMLYAVGPSFLIPGAIMTIAAGLAFGALWGAVYSLIGANLGALIAFGAGRFLGRGFVERTVGSRFEGIFDKISRHGFQIILYLRLVPLIPYNALNLLAGASPIDFQDYLWASIIGIVPGTVLYAFLGDALWHPASPRFLAAVALIIASVIFGELFRRWRALPTAS